MKLRFMVDFSARPHLIKKATRGRTGCRVQPENPRVRPFIRRNERNMQKKKITAFLLALAMVSAMALPVFAQEPNPQAETAASIAVVETATPETAATEEPKVDAEPAEDNVKEDAATYDAPPENGWYQEYPGGPGIGTKTACARAPLAAARKSMTPRAMPGTGWMLFRAAL